MAAVWKAPWTALLVVLFTASTHALVIQHNASKGTAMWSTYNGKSYLYVASPTVTRDGAAAACTALGAELVTIGDAAENTFIGTLLPQSTNTNAWIANEVGDGLYSNFLPGRPNGADVCVRFFSLVWGSYEDSWDDNGCSTSLGYVCVTGASTPNPTPSPTPGAIAGPTPGGISAVGDPHLSNVLGQRFDLMKPGKHVLINIPRGRSKNVMIRVEAEAQQVGETCGDMYFQELNVTGSWVEEKHAGGLRFQAQGAHDENPRWQKFGKVQMKVAHGHTQQGTQYLNFYVKHLGHAGLAVGGLLGEDDHQEAATPSAECARHSSLLQMPDRAPASAAEASFM
jgi:hypothetical protein